MKKLLLVATVVLSTLTFAQERTTKEERLTPEQQTELKVKQMTLDLDLTAKQQGELKTIILAQAQKRQAEIAAKEKTRVKGQKRSANERFEMKNKMLAEQIEMKAQMKETLSAEQFSKWEAKKENSASKMKENRKKRAKQAKANQEVTK